MESTQTQPALILFILYEANKYIRTDKHHDICTQLTLNGNKNGVWYWYRQVFGFCFAFHFFFMQQKKIVTQILGHSV